MDHTNILIINYYNSHLHNDIDNDNDTDTDTG